MDKYFFEQCLASKLCHLRETGWLHSLGRGISTANLLDLNLSSRLYVQFRILKKKI